MEFGEHRDVDKGRVMFKPTGKPPRVLVKCAAGLGILL